MPDGFLCHGDDVKPPCLQTDRFSLGPAHAIDLGFAAGRRNYEIGLQIMQKMVPAEEARRNYEIGHFI